MRTIAALIGLACLVIPAHGGHCVSNFRGHHGGYHQQYHHAKQVQAYYLVGQPIRDEAYDAKLLDKARQAFKADLAELKEALNLRFRGEGRIVFEGEAGAGTDVAVGDAAGGAMPDTVAAALTRSCVDCHGPTKQSGGLDLTKPISDARIAAEIGMRVVTDDAELRMPPAGTIEQEDRQAIFDYSVSVSKALRKGATP